MRLLLPVKLVRPVPPVALVTGVESPKEIVVAFAVTVRPVPAVGVTLTGAVPTPWPTKSWPAVPVASLTEFMVTIHPCLLSYEAYGGN